MSTPVKLAEKAEDQPRAASLIAVALSALCAGLATAHGVHALFAHPKNEAQKTQAQPSAPQPRVARSPQANANRGAIAVQTTKSAMRAAAPSPAQPSEPEAAPAVAEAEPEQLAAAEPAPAEPVPAQPAAVAEPAPVEPTPAQPAAAEPAPAELAAREPANAARTDVGAGAAERAPIFQMGIVAYDRCEGLSQRPGRFPCPRDLRLEAEVWQALRTLEACDLAKTQRGQGEVRYEWTRGAAMQLRVRGPKRDAVDHAIVTKCTGRALGAARTSFDADHLVVRFRFELN